MNTFVRRTVRGSLALRARGLRTVFQANNWASINKGTHLYRFMSEKVVQTPPKKRRWLKVIGIIGGATALFFVSSWGMNLVAGMSAGNLFNYAVNTCEFTVIHEFGHYFPEDFVGNSSKIHEMFQDLLGKMPNTDEEEQCSDILKSAQEFDINLSDGRTFTAYRKGSGNVTVVLNVSTGQWLSVVLHVTACATRL